MRQFLSVLSFIILQINLVFCQNDHTSSLLWRISGKGIPEYSYLFGTMHVQDESVFQMEATVKEYILLCDAFAMEVLMDEINPVALQNMMIMKNMSLKDILSEENYLFLDTYMKDKLGQGVMMFNKMKPFYLSAQLMQSEMAKDKALPMDMEFLNFARSNNKSVFGLEEIEDQIRAVDEISLEDQTDMLMQMIRDTLQKNNELDQLMNLYISQNIEELYLFTVSDTSLPENFQKVFLISRNYGMVKKIIRYSKKQTVVYAVGAAHLGGHKGIIAILRNRGYTVEPVTKN